MGNDSSHSESEIGGGAATSQPRADDGGLADGATAATAAQAAAAAAQSAAMAGVPVEGAAVEGAAVADRLAAADAEIAKLKDDYLRALAETENLRRRGARERQEAGQYAVSSFARDVLAVADNLQRALAAVDPAIRAQDGALDALMSGIEMTEKELLTVFERYGIRPIAAEGQPFDPHVHEALYEIPNAEVPHGTVLQVMQPGYMIHDRTLRPARVGISRGGPKAGAKPAADQPAAEPGADPAEPAIEFPQRGAGDAYKSAEDSASGSHVDERS